MEVRKLKVSIISATPDPMTVISLAAGTCYGKHDISNKRVANCFKSGHLSVFEHASITFEVDGISRACSHQLVRHRLASFCQESQRYCRIDTYSDDWYVKPESFGEHKAGLAVAFFYIAAMKDAAKSYKNAIDAGIKPEDARYLLPEATKTRLTVSMNCRELFHFLDMRQQQAAQWEIRDLANQLENAVRDINSSWQEVMQIRGDNSGQSASR